LVELIGGGKYSHKRAFVRML